jgi:hypothetical protein
MNGGTGPVKKVSCRHERLPATPHAAPVCRGAARDGGERAESELRRGRRRRAAAARLVSGQRRRRLACRRWRPVVDDHRRRSPHQLLGVGLRRLRAGRRLPAALQRPPRRGRRRRHGDVGYGLRQPRSRTAGHLVAPHQLVLRRPGLARRTGVAALRSVAAARYHRLRRHPPRPSAAGAPRPRWRSAPRRRRADRRRALHLPRTPAHGDGQSQSASAATHHGVQQLPLALRRRPGGALSLRSRPAPTVRRARRRQRQLPYRRSPDPRGPRRQRRGVAAARRRRGCPQRQLRRARWRHPRGTAAARRGTRCRRCRRWHEPGLLPGGRGALRGAARRRSTRGGGAHAAGGDAGGDASGWGGPGRCPLPDDRQGPPGMPNDPPPCRDSSMSAPCCPASSTR